MSEVEARLRATLADALDTVTADPGRAAATLRRARRGRALRGLAAGLSAVLVVASVALAWEPPEGDAPPPACEPGQAATFALDFGQGEGTLTVEVRKAQACFALSEEVVAFGVQLRYDPDGPADPIVASVGLPGRGRAPRCRPVDPSDAARVLAEPGRHYVSLTPGLAVERASVLEPLDPAPESAPDVVEIVCSQDGAVALTPQAQPQRDGVHLRIYNQSGAWRRFNLTSPAGGDAGGRLPRRGGGFGSPWNLQPGPHLIGCFRDERSVPYADPGHPDYAAFTIVDPQGLWIDPELDCPEDRSRRKIVTDEPRRDPLELPDVEAMIREHVPGIRADDVIVRATYPESAAKIENRTVVRDGRKIATLYLVSEEVEGRYRWAIDPEVCPGAGIGDG